LTDRFTDPLLRLVVGWLVIQTVRRLNVSIILWICLCLQF